MISTSNKSLEHMLPFCATAILKTFKMADLWTIFKKKLRKNEIALLLLELRSAHLVRAYKLCFLFVQPPFWKIPRWPTYGWFLWKINLLCSCHFENKIRNGLPTVIFAFLNRESIIAGFFSSKACICITNESIAQIQTFIFSHPINFKSRIIQHIDAFKIHIETPYWKWNLVLYPVLVYIVYLIFSLYQ